MNSNITGMLTINEVAQLLNVHINTVRRWSNQGVLKAYRIGSRGDRRFRQEDVANFLAAETRGAKLMKRQESPFDKLGTVS
ncbi:helix-turn-helix domain-containing protein [Chloroflexota bacterium]